MSNRIKTTLPNKSTEKKTITSLSSRGKKSERESKSNKPINTLDPIRVNKWLSENSILSTHVSMDKMNRNKLLQMLRDEELEYGNIDNNMVAPYLNISLNSINVLNNAEINPRDLITSTEPKSVARLNLEFLYDSVTENYFEQESVKESFKSFFNEEEAIVKINETDEVNITISDFDYFQKVSITINQEMPSLRTNLTGKNKNIWTELITINYPLYGVKSLSKIWPIKNICSTTPNLYMNFYDLMDIGRARKMAFLIYHHNLIGYVKYNPSLTNEEKMCFGINTIINLPSLAASIQRLPVVNPISFFNYLDRYTFPNTLQNVGNVIEVSASCVVIEYLSKLKKKDRGLNNDLFEFIKNTEIPLQYVSEFWNNCFDNLPENIKNVVLKNPQYQAPECFRSLNDRIIDNAFNQLGIEVAPGSKTEQLINYYEVDPDAIDNLFGVGTIINERKAHYYDEPTQQRVFPRAYYLSTRGITLPMNVDFIDVYTVCVCSIQDYGVLGKSDKNANPFPPILVNYIINYIKAHDLVISLNRYETISSICDFLSIQNSQLINLDHLQLILLRGYINPLPINRVILQRHDMWRSFTPQQIQFSRAGYSDNGLNDISFSYMYNPVPEFEDLISTYTGDNLKEIMDSLGMILPEDSDRMTYFVESLPQYLSFISRDSGDEEFIPYENVNVASIDKFADYEICVIILGGYTGHRNRRELLDQAIRVINGSNSFALVLPDPDIGENEELRKEQISFDVLKPTNNKYNISFCYKTPARQCIFSVTELEFMNHDITLIGHEENQDTRLEKSTILIPSCDFINKYSGKTLLGKEAVPMSLPNNMLVRFARVIAQADSYLRRHVTEGIERGEFTEINKNASKRRASARVSANPFRDQNDNFINISPTLELRPEIAQEIEDEADTENNLYIIFTNNNAFTYLLERVNEINRRMNCSNAAERRLIEEFEGFDKNTKNKICDALLQVFDCGMLQRQWDGKNRKNYPVTANQTGSESKYENKKDKIVGAKLAEISGSIDQLESSAPKNAKGLPVQTSINPGYFFQNLPIMTPDSRTQNSAFSTRTTGQSPQATMTIRFLIDLLNSGAYCIRIGSTPMVMTGFYYLRLFGGVSLIGDFNFWELDSIS